MSEHKLRPMTEADLEKVLCWRNHSEVRRYMYTTHKIDLGEHEKWFASASSDPAIHLLIYEHQNRPCGFVNITHGRCVEVADWGFYMAPESPKGAGRQLGKQALRYAFETLNLHKLCGQALGFNERSVAFHEKLGFCQEGRLRDQHFDGSVFHDVVCFGLLKQEWQTRVKELKDE